MGEGQQKKHPYLYWEFPELRMASRPFGWTSGKRSVKISRRGILILELYNLETGYPGAA